MANRYPLILNAAAGQLQELPTGDSLDLGGESILGVKLGSQEVPSISFTGDNTGIYSPGADQVAISTGGTGRLFVDASGNVGIGTSTPNTVGYGGGVLGIFGSASTGGNIWLTSDTTTAGTRTGRIGFGTEGNTGGKETARIWSLADGTTTGNLGGNLLFHTKSDGGSLTERMRITSAGLLGLGTSSPAAKIHSVETSAAEGLRVDGASGGFSLIVEGGTARATRSRQVTIGNSYVGNTPPTNGLIIEGSVGIGTTAPNNKLEIAGTTANLGLDGTSNTYINFLKSAANIGYVGDANWIFGGSSSDFGIRATSNLVLGIGANERARIRGDGTFEIKGAGTAGSSPAVSVNPSAPANSAVMDSSGRLGLGTSSPAAILHTLVSQAGSTAAEIFRAQATNTTDNVITRLEVAAEPALGTASLVRLSAITGNAADSANMAFNVRNASVSTEVLRLSSTGRVGIGTTSPGKMLEVSTALSADGIALSRAGSNRVLLTADGLVAWGATANQGTLTWDTNQAIIRAAASNSLVFAANNSSEHARIDTSGRLGLGTSDPGAKLDVCYSDSTTTLASLTQIPNGIRVFNTDTTANNFALVTFAGSVAGTAGAAIGLKNTSNAGSTSLLGRLFFATKKSGESTLTEAMCIDESQRVGIGTTSPSQALTVAGSILSGGAGTNYVASSSDGVTTSYLITDASGSNLQVDGAWPIRFTTNSSERARIDTSGRLLIGTSTARSNFFNSSNSARFQIEGSGSNDNYALSIVSNYAGGTNGAQVILAKSGGSNVGDNTLVSNGNAIGVISFQGADGTEFVPAASITGEVDGTPGANVMPGCLMFSTNNGTANAGPTERMRINSSGQILAGALGTAALPIISFLNDPNTGLFSPGADQLAISTNGTGRLFVDASGNVGVGGSPSLRLDVTATNDNGIRFSTTGTSNSARLELNSGNGTTSGKYAYIKVQNNDTNAQGYAFGAFGDDRWVIRDTKANSERLCIDTSGRLGLGTSSPGHRLDVNGEVAFSPNTAGKNTFYFTTNASNDASLFLKSDTTNKVNIQANGTSYFNGGNVGIGTTSPGQLFHLRANSCNFYLQPVSNAEARIQAEGETAGVGTAITFHNYNGSANGERARLDSSGRLLVGTSSVTSTYWTAQTSTFQVQRNGNYASINVIGNSTGAYGSYVTLGKSRGTTAGSFTIVNSGDSLGGISFEGADGSAYKQAAFIEAVVDGTPGANDMPGRLVFSTTADGSSSPTERMRINNAGRMGIGTTTPASIFQVRVAANQNIAFNQLASEARITCYNDGVSAAASLGLNGSDLRLQTNDIERMRITAAGLVGLGTSSPTNTAGFSQQLQLTGNLPCISIDNTGTGANKYSLGVNSVGALGFWDNTASAFRMYINSSGQVGIGTTSPVGLLDLGAADSATALAIASWRAASYNGSILQWGGITASQWSTAAFFTGGSERARIDSSGRLGLGTSSPTTGKLHIYLPNNDATPNAISTEIAGAAYPGTDNMSAGKFVNNALGATAYGIWAQTTDVGYGIRYAGYFKCAGYVYGNSYGLYAENTQPNVNGSGVAYAGYFKALSAGTGTLGVICGLRVENTAAVGGTSYGALISTVSGPSTVIPFAVEHAGSERLRIDGSGNVGIGASSTSGARLFVAGGALTSSTLGGLAISASLSAGRLTSDSGNINSIHTYLDSSTIEIAPGSTFKNGISINGNGTSADTNTIKFFTANSERARIDSSGRLGIGTSSPSQKLQIATGNVQIDSNYGFIWDNSTTGIYGNSSPSVLQFYTGNAERARIDSSGRLLVGTSISQDKYFNGTGNGHLVQIESTSVTLQSLTVHGGTNTGAGAHFTFARSGGTAVGSVTAVASGDNLARLSFQGADGTDFLEAAAITCNVDGTPGANDMPGRLVFSTTADGAASPTERMRIDSAGRMGIGTTSPNTALEVNGTIRSGTGSGAILAVGSIDVGRDIGLADGQGIVLGSARRISISSTGTTTLNAAAATAPCIANIGASEVVRIDSSGRLLVGGSADSGGALLQVFGDRIRIGTAKTPASATATGTTGEIAWDANYIYVCTATNTWKRTAISTW